jgi:hypothetical protein
MGPGARGRRAGGRGRCRSEADTALLPSIGLNIHFHPAIQLKLQYTKLFYVNLVKDEDVSNSNPLDLIASRLVLAF